MRSAESRGERHDRRAPGHGQRGKSLRHSLGGMYGGRDKGPIHIINQEEVRSFHKGNVGGEEREKTRLAGGRGEG